MPEPTIVTLDEKMLEIVDQAIADGDGATPEDIVRLALEDWWGRVMLSGYTPEEMKRIGDEIIADTRPGIPADEVFARLKSRYGQNIEAAETSNAA